MTKSYILLHDPLVDWGILRVPVESTNFFGVVALDGGASGEAAAIFGDADYLRGVGQAVMDLADRLEDCQVTGELIGEALPAFSVDADLGNYRPEMSRGEALTNQVIEFLRKRDES